MDEGELYNVLVLCLISRIARKLSPIKNEDRDSMHPQSRTTDILLISSLGRGGSSPSFYTLRKDGASIPAQEEACSLQIPQTIIIRGISQAEASSSENTPVHHNCCIYIRSHPLLRFARRTSGTRPSPLPSHTHTQASSAEEQYKWRCKVVQ